MSDIRIKVGQWIEREPREIRFVPSYYAADWQLIRTHCGEYDLYVAWRVCDLSPYAHLVGAAIASETLDGYYYSGIGGVNYASTPIRKGPYTYRFHAYAYQIPEMVAEGSVVLDDEFAFLAREDASAYIRENLTNDMIIDYLKTRRYEF